MATKERRSNEAGIQDYALLKYEDGLLCDELPGDGSDMEDAEAASPRRDIMVYLISSFSWILLASPSVDAVAPIAMNALPYCNFFGFSIRTQMHLKSPTLQA